MTAGEFDIPIGVNFTGNAQKNCIENNRGCGDFRENVTAAARNHIQWMRTPPEGLEEQYQQIPFTRHDVASVDASYYCDGPVYDEDTKQYRCGLMVACTLRNMDNKALAVLSYQSEKPIG